MEQFNIFEELYEELPIVKSIKLGTFFSGIGAPEKALGNIGIDYDLQFFSEIDKYAIKAYCAIHDESEEKCVGSISDLKGVNLPYCDMWFGGFPCQDISLAGNGKGFALETESRSSLGWEMIRLLREVKTKPKYIVFENVAAIFNETHRPVLNLFKQDLEELGYTLFNKLLNSKDYGVPQNRNRYFLVAILGEYNYKFPTAIPLNLKLKDTLEDEVNNKYYLTDNQMERMIVEPIAPFEMSSALGSREHEGSGWKNIASTLCARDYKDPKVITIPNVKNINNIDDVMSTLGTNCGSSTSAGGGVIVAGQIQPKDRYYNKNGREREEQFETRKDELSNSILTNDIKNMIQNNLRIRKLTPLECYRLQAFADEDFYKAEKVISNSQLYKTAGNSITVKVLEAIFTNLFLSGKKY